MCASRFPEWASIRDTLLHEQVAPYAAAVFARMPAVASVTFLVAQFYNDNAQDEVHGAMLLSSKRWPDWPHICAAQAPAGSAVDQCTRCIFGERHGIQIPSFLLGYRTALWRAFEPYCREGCTQHMTMSDAYLPYAVAHRAVGGGVTLQVVGQVVRPWLVGSPAAAPDTRQWHRHSSEARLARDPTDRAAWLAYADWLEAESDPRALLVRADLRTPWTELQQLGPWQAGDWAEHGPLWLGRFHRDWPRAMQARWRGGFWDSVRLTGLEYPAPEPEGASWTPEQWSSWAEACADIHAEEQMLLRYTVSHPSARFLRALHLWGGTSPLWSAQLRTVRSAPPSLCSLTIALDAVSHPNNPPADFRGVWGGWTALEALTISGAVQHLEAPATPWHMPNLRRLSLALDPTSLASVLPALSVAMLPRLAVLDVTGCVGGRALLCQGLALGDHVDVRLPAV